MHSFALMWKKTRAAIMGLICVIVAAIPQSLCAQTVDRVTINNTAAPALGTIVRGSSTSKFRVAASTGAIARESGNAQRLNSTSTVSVPTVTILCADSLLSSKKCTPGTVMNVTISSSSTIPIEFEIAETAVANVDFGARSTSRNPLTFSITFNRPQQQSTAVFKLGFMVDVLANSPTGQLSLPYTVSISRP
jgi:hypothetical protein